ncbi:MAG: rod-binding protein [Lachnospiraceae bacterium]|nr:rod-binding protein [Lachnospiraceae bacterium]
MDINSISSYYNDMYTNASKQQADKLEDKLKSDYSQATDEELMDVCKQFEAYFVEQMFKEMANTIPVNEERTGANATLVDYYKDQMIQNIATESTEQSGLGLAQMLYEQMRRNYGLDAADIATE